MSTNHSSPPAAPSLLNFYLLLILRIYFANAGRAEMQDHLALLKNNTLNELEEYLNGRRLELSPDSSRQKRSTSAMDSYFESIAEVEGMVNKRFERSNLGRSLTDMMGLTLDNINDYGCWCYFEDHHGSGRGPVVNDVDLFCRALHQGYDCAIMDGIDTNDPCVPWSVGYTSRPSNVNDIVTQCQDENQHSQCSINACIVEAYFVINIFQSFLAGNQHSEIFLHNNGFDVDVNCPVIHGQASDKECCGEYPFRHPYKTLDGGRACCNSETYLVDGFYECCSNSYLSVAC